MQRRSMLFTIGDCLFLCLVGAVTAEAMRLAHQLDCTFVLTWIIGMTGVMVLQVFLAFLAAPILGMIESMVPSMIVAMAGSTSVCVSHLVGGELGSFKATALGVSLGMGMFLYVVAFGNSCRNSLLPVFPNTRAPHV